MARLNRSALSADIQKLLAAHGDSLDYFGNSRQLVPRFEEGCGVTAIATSRSTMSSFVKRLRRRDEPLCCDVRKASDMSYPNERGNRSILPNKARCWRSEGRTKKDGREVFESYERASR